MQKPMIIDSHAHLDYPQLADDLPGVLARAKDAGVSQIISIGVKLSSSHAPREIAETHDDVWFSVGVHPHEAANETLSCNREAFLAAADHPKCVAIGEAGLDYFYDFAPRNKQAESFRVQIGVARELGLPIIIHARDADEDIAAIIEDEMAKGVFSGVLHCFSSSANLARHALALGFYISFSGILTFKKAEEIRDVASFAPADKILVETDAPFLAPTPHRGKINEPAFTKHTLACLAEVRGLPEEEMASQTTQNTLRLFSRIENAI
tara:strand:- start:182 stop:979 length:798 start_codon:yes stop_codon:yes gene_type:complete